MWVGIVCGLVVYKLLRHLFYSDDSMKMWVGIVRGLVVYKLLRDLYYGDVSMKMWVEIVRGLVVYKLLSYLFYSDDSIPDVNSTDTDLCFIVANRLEKLHRGKSYVGLRIPDPDTSTRLHIDVVVVTKREIMVVAVRNFFGFVQIGGDGWVRVSDKNHKLETYSDPVLEVKRQVEILELYLEQRGSPLPKGSVIGRVVLPNPNCRAAHSIASQPEVISFEEWTDLKPESKSKLSWITDAFHGGKSEPQEGFYQNLHFILSTAPMLDRLELKGDRYILGEFMEFRGNQSDIHALRNLKRAKISRFVIQKPFLLGLGRSSVQILYSQRDYRANGLSSTEWKEVAVTPSTEVLFQPLNSKRVKNFRITSIVSVHLSA